MSEANGAKRNVDPRGSFPPGSNRKGLGLLHFVRGGHKYFCVRTYGPFMNPQLA